jgi:hypothetical protein
MLLCNITNNLGFADAQLLGKFLMNVILNNANNTTVIMLRHDNDAKACSKHRSTVFRSEKN